MAEGLATPEGKVVEVDAAEQTFARAMAEPVEEIPAPPVREEKPKPRRGRPPKNARAEAPKSKPAKPAAPVKDDYTEDAQGFVGGIWTVMASIPPTQAYAYPIGANSDALASALAAGAKKNETIRRMLTGGGDSAWMIQLAAVGLNIGMTGMQIARDPELKKQAAEATRQQLQQMIAANAPAEEKAVA